MNHIYITNQFSNPNILVDKFHAMLYLYVNMILPLNRFITDEFNLDVKDHIHRNVWNSSLRSEDLFKVLHLINNILTSANRYINIKMKWMLLRC